MPWQEDEIEVWRRARRAVDITGDDAPPAPPTIADAVVLAAARSLTRIVNLNSGLAHPRDKAAAVHTFRRLKRGGYDWDPSEIRIWAMANGWRAEDAQDLEDVADGVRQGRRYRVGASPWRSDIISHWRSGSTGTVHEKD